MSIKTARYPFIGLSILFFILLIQNPLLEAIYNTLYITYFVFSFLFFMSLALGQYTKVAVQKNKLMVLKFIMKFLQEVSQIKGGKKLVLAQHSQKPQAVGNELRPQLPDDVQEGHTGGAQ